MNPNQKLEVRIVEHLVKKIRDASILLSNYLDRCPTCRMVDDNLLRMIGAHCTPREANMLNMGPLWTCPECEKTVYDEDNH